MTSPRSYLTRVALRGEVPMLMPPRRPGRLWSDPRFAADDALDQPPTSIRRAAVAAPDGLASPMLDAETAPVTPAAGPRVARVAHASPTAVPGHADAPATPVGAPVVPYTITAAVITSAAASSEVGEVSEVAAPVAPGRAPARARAPAPRAPGEFSVPPDDPPARRAPAELPSPGGRIAARAAAAAERPAEPPATPPARSTDVASAPATAVVRTPPAAPSVPAPRARPGRLSLGEALTAAFAWTSSSDDAASAPAKQPAPTEPPRLQIEAIDIEVVPPVSAPKSDPAARLARGYSRLARRG